MHIYHENSMNVKMHTYGDNGTNINTLYEKLVQDIYENGSRLEKNNGTKLREIIPASIEIPNPKQGILLKKFRSYNPAFMIAECLWNLTGDTREWLADYNEKYRKYFKNHMLLAGYGNRIINGARNQIEEVSKLLKEKPDSSRATISIFDPLEDYKETNFVPCISFLKFRILTDNKTKQSKLYMWSFMRAQDIWKGFPYDIYLLLSIFQYMSSLIDVPMGSYFHICDTIRLYDEDKKDIELFLENLKNNYEEDIEYPSSIEMHEEQKVDFSDLQKYRDLIMYDNFDEKLLIDIPEFWRNSILTCWVYKQIKMKEYNKAYYLLNKITNEFKIQLIIWSRKYNKNFYYFYYKQDSCKQ